ncbi:MAG TPA: acyl carrier protein, partial [Rudaea sp.]|nr:acyl carrier protein [Rudaea sp.]
MAQAEPMQTSGTVDVAGASPADVQARLLAIVRDTFVELRRESAERGRVTIHSSLDRDLGFDSLARVELLLRIERAFDTHLGEE